jgi:PPOX class probable F420-dependent enzyme
MPMELPQPARELIESDVVATIVTVGPDGAPEPTAAWVGLEDGEIVIGTLSDQRKLRNIRRNPRVALTLLTERVNEFGLLEYLVVRGRARVTEGGGSDLLQRLAHVYLGPDVVFPPFENPPPGYVTRIAVESIGGVGPWKA